MVVASFLKFIPANFFIEVIERNEFCCPCSYSGSLDLDFLCHPFHIVSSYPK